MTSFSRFTSAAVACLLISGCITAPAKVRALENDWRQRLAENAPPGTPRNEVESLFEQHGLTPAIGTYRIRHEDGSESSHCRLPERAVTTRDRSAVRGLYLKWDLEVTVCLDENDRVESHYVGAWNAGI